VIRTETESTYQQQNGRSATVSPGKPPGYEFTIGRILAIYSRADGGRWLLAALDQTIVATALPKGRLLRPRRDHPVHVGLHGVTCSARTVTVPLYGKLGDVHGRKPLFIVAIVIFLVGSALCGAAQNMWELVIFPRRSGHRGGGNLPADPRDGRG